MLRVAVGRLSYSDQGTRSKQDRPQNRFFSTCKDAERRKTIQNLRAAELHRQQDDAAATVHDAIDEVVPFSSLSVSDCNGSGFSHKSIICDPFLLICSRGDHDSKRI